jgi:hypothetical protein
MPDWLVHVLTSATTAAATVAAAVWFIQHYVLGRMRHHFDVRLEEVRQEHREVLEGAKPLTAEATLRRENYLNSKRDAFYEALSLLARSLASRTWEGDGAVGIVPANRPVEQNHPSESEVNECLAKLTIYTDRYDIVQEFASCLVSARPGDLTMLAGRMRQDMGYGDSVVTPEKTVYYYAGPTAEGG